MYLIKSCICIIDMKLGAYALELYFWTQLRKFKLIIVNLISYASPWSHCALCYTRIISHDAPLGYTFRSLLSSLPGAYLNWHKSGPVLWPKCRPYFQCNLPGPKLSFSFLSLSLALCPTSFSTQTSVGNFSSLMRSYAISAKTFLTFCVNFGQFSSPR